MKSIEEKERFVKQVIDCLMAHQEIDQEKAKDMIDCALRYPETTDLDMEYRFMGSFGFGGKLRLDNWRGGCIYMYLEDETPGRRTKMNEINKDLRGISKSFGFNP